MRQLVYSVAASLDGFIAGPNGEYDWIVRDPSIDFGEIFGRFDTLVMGRHSYEGILREGHSVKEFGMKAFVVSTDLAKTVADLKTKSGKDIWLFGGGNLFRSLLDAGLVDRVDIALIPVLLGGGIPLIPQGRRWSLRFKDSRTFPSGIVSLTYGVASEPRI